MDTARLHSHMPQFPENSGPKDQDQYVRVWEWRKRRFYDNSFYEMKLRIKPVISLLWLSFSLKWMCLDSLNFQISSSSPVLLNNTLISLRSYWTTKKVNCWSLITYIFFNFAILLKILHIYTLIQTSEVKINVHVISLNSVILRWHR